MIPTACVSVQVYYLSQLCTCRRVYCTCPLLKYGLFFRRNRYLSYDFSWPSMPKRNCTFTKELENDYPFLKKLCGHNDRVKCQQCLSEFSIAHGGKADIKDHLKCSKHKASVSAIASSSFFKTVEPAENELSIAAKEATFAFHKAMHDISFKTSDCFSKLISKLFESKFQVRSDHHGSDRTDGKR